jgi:hypothetical protein
VFFTNEGSQLDTKNCVTTSNEVALSECYLKDACVLNEHCVVSGALASEAASLVETFPLFQRKVTSQR